MPCRHYGCREAGGRVRTAQEKCAVCTTPFSAGFLAEPFHGLVHVEERLRRPSAVLANARHEGQHIGLVPQTYDRYTETGMQPERRRDFGVPDDVTVVVSEVCEPDVEQKVARTGLQRSHYGGCDHLVGFFKGGRAFLGHYDDVAPNFQIEFCCHACG